MNSQKFTRYLVIIMTILWLVLSAQAVWNAPRAWDSGYLSLAILGGIGGLVLVVATSFFLYDMFTGKVNLDGE